MLPVVHFCHIGSSQLTSRDAVLIILLFSFSTLICSLHFSGVFFYFSAFAGLCDTVCAAYICRAACGIIEVKDGPCTHLQCGCGALPNSSTQIELHSFLEGRISKRLVFFSRGIR